MKVHALFAYRHLRAFSSRSAARGIVKRWGLINHFLTAREDATFSPEARISRNNQAKQFWISHRRFHKRALTDLEKARFKVRCRKAGLFFFARKSCDARLPIVAARPIRPSCRFQPAVPFWIICPSLRTSAAPDSTTNALPGWHLGDRGAWADGAPARASF